MFRRSIVVCIAFFLVALIQTLGAGGVGTEYIPQFVPFADPARVVINELNIAPDTGDSEFIELYNIGVTSVDLNRLFLRDKRALPVRISDYSTILPPNRYIVLTRDSSVILDRFGPVPVIQVRPWPSLNNGGDEIVISEEGETLDRVAYTASWHAPGRSLERVDPFVPGFIRSNWEVNITKAGASPGAVNSRYSPDTLSPTALSAEYIDEAVVEVTFSEAIDPASLPAGSLFADGFEIGQYQLISPFTSLQFIPGRPVIEIEMSTFSDFSGNTGGPVKLEVARRVHVHDIAITEIMFDPGPDVAGVRTPEFVELHSLRSFPLSLTGLELEIGRMGTASRKRYPLRIPGSILKARSFAVLYSDKESVSATDPASESNLFKAHPRDYHGMETLLIPVVSSNLGLVNTAGFVRLLREHETPIDAVEYLASWHDDRYAETKGRSIARIDPHDTRSDALRWTSSSSADGATPGESMRITRTALEPRYGVIRLNEIMFDPVSDEFDHRADQPEYLEMINVSSVPLDLNGMYLTARSGERVETDSIRLGYRPTALPPGGYAVVFTLPGYVPDGDANASDFLRAAFPSLPARSETVLLPVRSRLKLVNEGKLLRLFSAQGVMQDEVWYRPEWHHFLVIDGSGSSLERIDAALAPHASNWTTSTSEYGGTPGWRNSVFQSDFPISTRGRIEIQPKTFSPNGDGVDDTARIRLFENRVPGALRVRIFDLYGRPVRTLSDFDFATPDHTLIWDGTDDSGRPLETGIYVVYVEIISTGDRKVESLKAPVAILR